MLTPQQLLSFQQMINTLRAGVRYIRT